MQFNQRGESFNSSVTLHHTPNQSDACEGSSDLRSKEKMILMDQKFEANQIKSLPLMRISIEL